MRRRPLGPWMALLAGVALLTNPIWLLPVADEPVHDYRATALEPSDVHADTRVLVCGDGSEPSACALERRALRDGVPVGVDPTAFEDRPSFVYLATEGRYYRTAVRWDGSARVATAVPVAYGTVVDRLATEAGSVGSEAAARVVATALAEGTAHSRERVVLSSSRVDGPVVVESNGRYYAVSRTAVVRPSFPFAADRTEWALRGVLALGGAILLGVGGRRLATRVG